MTKSKSKSGVRLDWRAYFTATLGDPNDAVAQEHAHEGAVQLAQQIGDLLNLMRLAASNEPASRVLEQSLQVLCQDYAVPDGVSIVGMSCPNAVHS